MDFFYESLEFLFSTKRLREINYVVAKMHVVIDVSIVFHMHHFSEDIQSQCLGALVSITVSCCLDG